MIGSFSGAQSEQPRGLGRVARRVEMEPSAYQIQQRCVAVLNLVINKNGVPEIGSFRVCHLRFGAMQSTLNHVAGVGGPREQPSLQLRNTGRHQHSVDDLRLIDSVACFQRLYALHVDVQDADLARLDH